MMRMEAVFSSVKNKLKQENGAEWYEVLLVAAGIIGLIGFIFVPILRNISTDQGTRMTNWFNTIASNIFRSS